ncbi:MAG: gliding motility protein GldM [Hymenobacteraceae bacterium]|nr:gliding motility protein GldM [Hymenobacteraceae bacterium]MDX5394692.1 gliding motility protein GldM [Hymenobacteraceae bacterium]MDX5510723.1 gliding motility protein GldM [Hymenobacteraceae bacterium]
MAGGKETPRQKMIGMMYLVLTALLALQVSSAIILKFEFLDNSLMTVNNKTVADNSKVIGSIKKAVAEAGSRDKDVAVVDKAALVRAETDKMISYLHGLRETLIKESGGMEQGHYKNPKEEEAIARNMIGASNKKDGKGYELKDKLNNYANFMNSQMGNYSGFNKIQPLALDGKEDPIASKDPDQRNKDFAHLNFETTPLVAALAVLAQKEAEVLKYESQALQTLAQQVGATDIKVDQVSAMARAESKTVAAGTKYKAEMFLAASSSAIVPEMSYQGKPVKVETDKSGLRKGLVEFTAAATNYDAEGNSKQKWKGQIKFKHQGKDTVFTVEEEYIVAKPVIQIQSASVQALYLNCGNELNVQVPALGATYDPSFSASGATAIKGAKKGMVTVIPNAREVKLNVSSAGNSIGSETFKVRSIPKPDIEVLANGKPVDEKRGMSAPGPRVIEIRAVADESFKQFLPQDARYRVTSWTAYLVRGPQPVDQMSSSSPTANLTQFASKARPGDRILIEVKEVKRMNFRDNIEDVNIGTKLINIPLN